MTITYEELLDWVNLITIPEHHPDSDRRKVEHEAWEQLYDWERIMTTSIAMDYWLHQRCQCIDQGCRCFCANCESWRPAQLQWSKIGTDAKNCAVPGCPQLLPYGGLG
jgi:hypothetical protein